MSAAANSDPLTIDVISDVVCPWCFIGKRRLEKAIAASEVPLAIRWRPYQLDATIPPEGKDRRAYLEAKFGSAERIKQLHENVAAAGAAEGIPFAFDKIKVSPNTLDAHRLIRWAEEQDAAGADRRGALPRLLSSRAATSATATCWRTSRRPPAWMERRRGSTRLG